MTDVFDDLDAVTLEIVGDNISYQPGGAGPVLSIKAFADHSDQTVEFGGTAGVVGDAMIQVRMIDVAQPTKADVITLPRTGLNYRPASWLRSKCGRLWNIPLKRAV